MQKDELDKIPLLVRKGILTKEKAAMKILEIAYTNPARFRLLSMSEDDRSEFLLDILPKLEGLILRHDPAVSPFGAYVYLSMPGLKATWLRKRYDRENIEKVLAPCLEEIYKDKADRQESCLADTEQRPSQKEEYTSGKNDRLVFKRVFTHQYKNLCPRGTVSAKRSALILALKSAWYMNDEKITKLSSYCGCPEKALSDKFASLRCGLEKKSQKHAEIVGRRDRAWYFICKYREKLLNLDRDSALYDIVRRKLEYQIKSWKTKNRLLENYRYKISPNNKEIENLVGIDRHRISAYIRYARDLADSGNTI